MSDQYLGKKLVEEDEVEPFLEEYERATGLRLDLVGSGERPDLLCHRSDGMELGVELTKVMVDPESRFWRRTLAGEAFMDPGDTVIHLQEAVYRKEDKRASATWHLPDRTVLVLQLFDSPLDEVFPLLDEQLFREMAETGFLEIWIADYTIREAYGTVQLCGVKPTKWRGPHDYIGIGTKPFG